MTVTNIPSGSEAEQLLEFGQRLLAMGAERLRAYLVQLDPDDFEVAEQAIALATGKIRPWRPQQHQQPPLPPWWTWVFSGGRGTGKSDTGSWWLDEHMKGPPCDPRVPGGHKALIGGPTHGTGVASTWAAPAGISVHNPQVKKVGRKEGTFLVWPNGAEAVVVGMHTEQDADQVRAHAGNCCTWWIDEAAIGRHLKLALDNLVLGARLGPHPHGIVTSTPKPTPSWKYLLGMPGVVQTVGSTYDNEFLPDEYREIIAQFEGTRWGEQELHGKLIEFYEGALWTPEGIDADRLADLDALVALELQIIRIAIGVDPSTWSPDTGDDPGTVGEGVETGIVVDGIDDQPKPHLYVLEDASGRHGPDGAAREIVRVYRHWEAVAPCSVVVESNMHGGIFDMVRLIDPEIHFHHEGKRLGVRAKVGKRVRAEPAAALYDQHRVHHVGRQDLLEAQMCLWDPRENWSPDRLDGHVYAITVLAPWAQSQAQLGAGFEGSVSLS